MFDELHQSDTKKQSGASAGLKATIGIAAAIICNLAMPATAGASGAMIAAATSSTASTMAVGLVDHKANFGKALKDLGKKENIQNLMISMAAAGVSANFKLPTGKGAPWQNHFYNAGIKNFTRAGLNIIVKNEKFKNAFVDALRSTAVDGIATFGAGVIGKHTSGWTHKLAHAALGGALGAAISPDDPRLGAISGAAGAVTAELIAEGLVSNLDKEIPNILENNPDIQTVASLSDKMYEHVKQSGEYAKLCTTIGSLFAGLDVNVAHRTASNAIDNNNMTMAFQLIRGALARFAIGGGRAVGRKIVADKIKDEIIASGIAADFQSKAETKQQQEKANSQQQTPATPGEPQPENNNDDQNKKKVPPKKQETKSEGKKGSNNSTVRESINEGKQKHNEFTEGLKKLKNEDVIKLDEDGLGPENKPDGLTDKMISELKPFSETGVKKGLGQIKRYINADEQIKGRQGLLYFYEPKKYPITYARIDDILQSVFKDDPIVQMVKQNKHLLLEDLLNSAPKIIP